MAEGSEDVVAAVATHGAALHGLDKPLGFAGDIIAHPELRAFMLWLDREQVALGRRLLGCAFCGKRVVEVERTGGILGCADIERAREMGEVFGHDRLLKRESSARG